MVRRSPIRVSLVEAKRGYEQAIRTLNAAYKREVLSTLSEAVDSAVSSGDLARLKQYKNFVDYLAANSDNSQFYNQLERLISADSGDLQEQAKPQPQQIQQEKPKKKRFKRRYFTVEEAIDTMSAADQEKWGHVRTRAAYYQKLKYLDSVKKATTLYSGNRLSRICIADLNGLLPELTQYSPR